MKFALAKEHRRHFELEGQLLLEALLTEQQLEALRAGIAAATKGGDPFLRGRDLWRLEPRVKAVVAHRRLSELAADLFAVRALRLGLDQFLPALGRSVEKSYPAFLQLPSLERSFALDGILGGLILSLASGEGLFLAASHPIPKPAEDSLLILYTRPKAVYRVNHDDPLTSFLLNCGYDYGDRLNDAANPLLIC